LLADALFRSRTFQNVSEFTADPSKQHTAPQTLLNYPLGNGIRKNGVSGGKEEEKRIERVKR